MHAFRRAFALAAGLAACLSFPLSLAGQALPAMETAPRVTTPVREEAFTTLTGNTHQFVTAHNDLGLASQATATGRISLVLRRSAAQQEALRQYLSDVQNPHSPSYHKWLTPTQYGSAFGVQDADLQTVEQWLQGHGLKVEGVSKGRNLLQFSGNFAQLQQTFHTAMHTVAAGGTQHFAAAADPQIPTALLPVIAAVGPLQNFRPVSQAKLASRGQFSAATRSFVAQPGLTLGSGSAQTLYVDPADAATIYDTPNATLNHGYKGPLFDGTGINIGIAGDSNIAVQDVVNYRTAFLGETAATANAPTVVVDGNDPLLNGDEIEGLLDNEVAGGIAPGAKLYFYTSADTDLESGLFSAIQRAINDNTVSILNISFGACEATLGNAGNQLVQELMMQAAAQGISVTVSTGDNGSAACDSSLQSEAVDGLQVNGLASTPYNIAVGGTDYDVLANSFSTYAASPDSSAPNGVAPYYGTALSYIPEEPWNDSTNSNADLASNVPYVSSQGSTDIVAGSGGASGCVTSTAVGSNAVQCGGGYAKPAFQTLLTPQDGVRDVPDVAFLAGNGFYSASWAVCADSEATGAPVAGVDCQTSNGALIDGASITGVGGTSAAAPAFAGMLALLEQKVGSRLGQADTVLYQLASSSYATVFHDVALGNNSVVCEPGSLNCGANGFLTGYDAGTGYDQASGLGSVDVAQMLTAWSTATLAPTQTSFTINGSVAPVNVAHGTTLTFNVGVSPAAVTGNVAIVATAPAAATGQQSDGQVVIPLTSGSGTVQYNGLPGGTYTVYARYSGDTNDAASQSTPAIQVTIGSEASTAALSVNVYSGGRSAAPITNLASVPYGSDVALDTQIYGAAEGQATQGLATGTVRLTDNGTLLAAALPISSVNQASYLSPSTAYPNVFAVGRHNFVAAYSGDDSYNAGTSSAVSMTVVQDPTQLQLSPASASISSLVADQLTIVLTTNSAGAIPTGTMTVTDNGTTIATLTGGYQLEAVGSADVQALVTLQGNTLAAGGNTITVSYSGDGNYAASAASTTITVSEASFHLTNGRAIAAQAGATSGNTSQITASPLNGFLGVVNLSCSVTAAPANAGSLPTCAIAPTANITGIGGVFTALTLNSSAATTPGTYAVTVSGADATTGKITASTTVAATLTAAPAAPSPGFLLSNGGSITVAPGATGGNTATLSIAPSNSFVGTVNLSCKVTTAIANPTDLPTCSVPASVSVSGAVAATATLTVATTGGTTTTTAGLARSAMGGVAFASVLCLLLPRRRMAALCASLLLCVGFAIAGCGGGGSNNNSSTGMGTPPPTTTAAATGTTAGVYAVTVTGEDAATGTLTATTAVNLVVN